MIHVRRHKRVTASGKTTTVRAHEREGDSDFRQVPAGYRPPHVSEVAPAGQAPAAEDWWDDDGFEVGAVMADCPVCHTEQAVNLGGTLAGHGPAFDRCPGSGTEVAPQDSRR